MTAQQILPAGKPEDTHLGQYRLDLPRQGLKLLFMIVGFGVYFLLLYFVLFPIPAPPVTEVQFEWFLRRDLLTVIRDIFLLVLCVFYAIPYSIWFVISTCKLIWLNPIIDVFEKGVTFRNRHGETTWQWVDFDGFQSKLMPVPLLNYVGEYRFFRDGKRIFSIAWDYQRMRNLQYCVLHNVGEALWEKYQGTYLDGQTIRFGRTIQLNQVGIMHRKRFIEWSNVIGYRVVKHDLHLLGADHKPILIAPIGKVINSNILLLLLDQIIPTT